ncbi:MAG: diguanylate cyclase [Lachnospiraceae bacterium]|nr:diguanylate cyclase [Lachnospiraceae bacterium]MBQ9605629.1 diguanylate cyclase [Lachnospiraceae bacterium]MBR1523397.1 diguanylate cyclase [Lachnospiraceae bacterium]
MPKSKIMIVDDEHISLAMTEHILSTAYTVVCASSGEDAIRMYFKEEPDMILSDLRMPGMSGFDLQQTLQKQSGHQIPFMFMTADMDEEIESKGFEIGALDFIRKPFRADVLLRRVANILQTMDQIQGLKKAAETDPMTGLLNKTSVQTEIDEICRQSKGALMMIDLDSFKPVNDIYGHDMGDKILIRFAEIICSAIRSSDIAGRMGGDEFIVFCQNVTDEAVIAEKTRYINENIVASAREFMGEDMSIPLGASIGCALAPQDGSDFLTLFKKADKALYAVKQNGKHGYSIYKESGDSDTDIASDATDLGSAIQILSERSPAKGAMTLSMEQFRLMFQFLTRVNANYQKKIHIVLFSLKGSDTDEMPSADITETFLDRMRSSLRQSDIITQSSKNQFLLILLKTTPPNAQLVIDRILNNWKNCPESGSVNINYEMKEME